jgi:hydrogenase maturation protease
MTKVVGMSSILVIGYGNSLRGDDAVGPVVAQAIADWSLPNLKILSLHQLTPELADDLAKVDTVYFVDACIDKDLEHPRVTEIQAKLSSVTISHFSSPSDLLALTMQIYDHVPQAYVIEIPAQAFDLSEELSGIAQTGVSEVLKYFRKLFLSESIDKNAFV